MAPTPLSASNLKPCYHQVGGHMSQGDVPESFVDDEGRFYKPFTDGSRAAREIVFYSALFFPAPEGQPKLHAPYPSPSGEPPEEAAGHAAAGPRPEDVEGLKVFIPTFYGTLEHQGNKLVALEDMCKPYKQPCVIDCKMGFSTVYEWADEKYRTKNKIKDDETTQSAVGFRISGLQVYRKADGAMFKPDRQWGKTLAKDTVGTAFELFASGSLPAKDLYGHPTHGALVQLRQLQDWAAKQASFQFFQASVLIMYDGDASCVEDAKLRVSFVDFAHTFQTVGGARDENLVSSLASLISIVEAAAA